VASHAIKSGKRYRNYVSARLISGSRSEAPDGMRVPSAEVENGVIYCIRRFLADTSSVFEMLRHMEPDVGVAQRLMRRSARDCGHACQQRTV